MVVNDTLRSGMFFVVRKTNNKHIVRICQIVLLPLLNRRHNFETSCDPWPKKYIEDCLLQRHYNVDYSSFIGTRNDRSKLPMQFQNKNLN